jgi:hypothetical protein
MTVYANVGHILLKRGNTVQSTAYKGPLGELTLDTDLHTVRVHDGKTFGGNVILASNTEVWALSNSISTITGLDAGFISNINTLLSNAATQQISLNTINANLGAFGTYANATFGTSSYGNANVALYLQDHPQGGTTYSNSNVASYLISNPQSGTYSNSNVESFIGGNVGSYQIYANANAATQATGINSINANIGAFQTYANNTFSTGTYSNSNVESYIGANVGSLWSNAAAQATSLNTITANLGAYQTYANANAATQAGSITTLQTQVYANANVAAYLPTYSGAISANIAKNGYAWTFGADGTTLFPEQAIDGGTAPIELKSRSWSQLTYNNADMTPAPNKNHSTTFFVEGGDALLEIFRWDSGNVMQHRQWTFSNDGSLSLPDTGTITFSDATVQNTAFSNAAVATYLSNYDGGINFTASPAVITGLGNISSANFTFGNGVNILSTVTGSYSNTQANALLSSNTVSTISTTGNIKTIANVIGTTFMFANGVNILSTITPSSSYSNTNVASYLTTATITTTGNVTAGKFIGDGSGLTGVALKTSGSWTVTAGTNTYSFTVPTSGTYQLWVDCNIPNGILAYNATATVTNSNVPVVGQQFAWVYNGGGTPVDFVSIPNQFTGTANTIVRSNTAPSATTNRFDFGINNTSGGNVTVSYGWIRIS